MYAVCNPFTSDTLAVESVVSVNAVQLALSVYATTGTPEPNANHPVVSNFVLLRLLGRFLYQL